MKREASQNAGCSHRYPRPPQLKSWELPTRLRLKVAFGASLPLWHRISDLQVQVTTQEAAQTSRSPMKSAERQPREVWSSRAQSGGRDGGAGTGSWELPTLAGSRDANAGAQFVRGSQGKPLWAAPSPVRASRPTCHVPAGVQSSMRWGRVHSSRSGISPLFHIGRNSNQLGAPNFQNGREV